MPCPEKFRDSLEKFEVDCDIIGSINEGFEKVVTKSPKKDKALYFKRAVDIMDERLSREKVCEILEWNACCKSGAREKRSKEFARINAALKIEEKLKKIEKAQYMNMGVPEIDENGLLRINAVSYFVDGHFACGCSNFNRVKRDYPVSKSYCFCCGGHFKYHYEIMLGVKLHIKDVVSSPLDSDGANPCVFTYEITKDA